MLVPRRAVTAMPSDRFITTTLSGTEDIASRLHEVGDRGKVLQDLRARKLANTSTSINYGFDNIKYESDAMSRQKDILKAPPRARAQERAEQKAMKSALTATHFVLGNDPVSYETEQKLALQDTEGKIKDCQGVLNDEVAAFIKRSSCHFGSDEPVWQSTMHDAQVKVDYSQMGNKSNMRQEAKKLKAELSAHNFAFGHDKLTYHTDSGDCFLWDPESAKGAMGQMADEVKKDLRRHHFAFGNDEIKYETDMQRSMKGVVITKQRLQEMADEKQNAVTLKKQLQQTNYEIGTDAKYM